MGDDVDTLPAPAVKRWDNQPPPEERIVDIEIAEVFEPLLGDQRFKGAHGGRGGAKSHFFAENLIDQSLDSHIRCACMREVQNSIKDSVKQLLEDKIAKLQVAHLFNVTDREITGPNDSLFIFRGLRNHTAASIKSLEGFNRGWVEEAQTISQRSLDIMIPTFRSNSQLMFSWNRTETDDPVDVMFRENYYRDLDPDFICVETNYWDNPWFPEELRRDMERDRRRDPEKYDHIWAGGYLKNSEARVFKNWVCESFESPTRALFMFGCDWGYSVDPTVLVRGFIGDWINGKAVPNPKGRTLFIDHEVYRIGCEIDHTPQLFDRLVFNEPQMARGWPIIADSANPQGISYLKRHGYPAIRGAVKGPNSIKEGIKFLQSYDIVVHPRCVHTRDELTHFSYEKDPKSGLILPTLSEKKNHVIDSLRYMVEPIRRPTQTPLIGSY